MVVAVMMMEGNLRVWNDNDESFPVCKKTAEHQPRPDSMGSVGGHPHCIRPSVLEQQYRRKL